MMEDARRCALLSGLRATQTIWKDAIGPQEGSIIRWCPVADLESARLCVGLSFEGRWAAGCERTAREFCVEGDAVFFLPVLDVAPAYLHDQLLKGLTSRGISEEFVKMFPFEDVMVTALQSSSEHWASLALGWANASEGSAKVLAALGVAADGGPTQSIRHAARRLWKARSAGLRPKGPSDRPGS